MLGFAQKYLPTSKLSGIGYARLYTLTLTMYPTITIWGYQVIIILCLFDYLWIRGDKQNFDNVATLCLCQSASLSLTGLSAQRLRCRVLQTLTFMDTGIYNVHIFYIFTIRNFQCASPARTRVVFKFTYAFFGKDSIIKRT